jgi:hypothetical protein
MVLMQIVSIMSQDEIGGKILFYLPEVVLDFMANVGKIAVPEVLDHNNGFPCCLSQKQTGAFARFFISFLPRTQNYPLEDRVFTGLYYLQDRSATADFYIVGVST